MDEPRGNIPEYTVTEISGAVKRTLEGAFGRVRVRGEITELKRCPSGHIYFSLKDEGGKLAGVVSLVMPSRVLAPPRAGSGKVELKLCRPDGGAGTRLFTRRDGEAFRLARRCGWGDALPGG